VSWNWLFSFLAAGMSVVLSAATLWRDRRSFDRRVFAAGLLALAGTEILGALSSRAVLAHDVLIWHQLRAGLSALAAGFWLLFSLSFARANYRDFLRKWRWVAVSVFAIPLLLLGLAGESVYTVAIPGPSSSWILPLGWSGYGLALLSLLSAVLILVNVESTLRASTGSIRWQIKFTLLGLGAIFAVQIYTSSHSLLYTSLDTRLLPLHSAALVLAALLILVSYLRQGLLRVDLYPSQAFLYNSLTLLIVGIYLFIVGGLAKAVDLMGGSQRLPLATFVVFVSLLFLAVVLLSDELRQTVKQVVDRHLRRPKHDYRKVWSSFTQRTGSLVDLRALGAAITKAVSETFGSPSVTLWQLVDAGERLTLGGSTALTEEAAETILAEKEGGRALIEAMGDEALLDLGGASLPGAGAEPNFFQRTQCRYAVTLRAGRERLGYLTLSPRVTKDPFTAEDFALLKTIADQAAAYLLNLKLSEEVLRAREMETFQTLAAFFIHDLKNLASRLSLAMQNLPIHFDNPAFRKDLLRGISQSVQEMNSLVSQLSPLSSGLELNRTETDLNALISSTLASLDGSLNTNLVQGLQPLPPVSIDGEQIQKVLINLVLNAREATPDQGEIRVSTGERGGWVILSVSDDGRGMSKEFIARSLFKPFQTTKRKGLGIGLFHSKKIVEAHRGRIEVESEPGKGSTFRVLLPLGEGKPNDGVRTQKP
jgi:putative PEP-CTERM system histidine kinase